MVVLSLTMLANFVATETAEAQDTVAVGVIDWESIMSDSKAAKSVNAQLNSQKEAFQAELRKKEESFRAEETKLKNERASLSEEEFKKRIQDLDKKLKAVKQEFRQKEKQIIDRYQKASKIIRDEALKIVRGIADQQKLTLIMNEAAVVLFDPQYDITKDTLEKLDQKLPSVKL